MLVMGWDIDKLAESYEGIPDEILFAPNTKLKRVPKTPPQLIRDLIRHDVQLICGKCGGDIVSSANFEIQFVICPHCRAKNEIPKL